MRRLPPDICMMAYDKIYDYPVPEKDEDVMWDPEYDED